MQPGMYLNTSIRLLRHGIQRVTQQVQPHLCQTNGFRPNHLIQSSHLNDGLGLIDARFQQNQSLVQALMPIQPLHLCTRASSKGQQRSGQQAHSFSLAQDMIQVLSGHIILIHFDKAFGIFCIGLNGRDGLIKFVGQGGRHLPHCRQFCGLNLSLLSLFQISSPALDQTLET